MSTALAGRLAVPGRFRGRPTADRALALAGAAVLTGAYVAVLAEVVDVVGGPGGLAVLAAEVLVAVALGGALAHVLRPRHAFAIGFLLLVAGLGTYLLTIPAGAIDVERQLQDTVALLTGLSVLRMTRAGVWALGFAPGPLFVSAFLFARRLYGPGVLVGGGVLAFFISTGDIGVLHGLVGTLGALAALGFGRLDREGGTRPQRDAVVALLVAVLVVTTSVSLVPGAEARPLLPGDRGTTVESSLITTDESVSVLGSIELSPEVRFVVRAQQGDRWRVGGYDRYTGDGWVRSGQSQPYESRLRGPPGDADRNRQTYEVQSATQAMPAAWKPTRIERSDVPASVTSIGGLEPARSLDEGDVYTVISHRPDPSRGDLREAGTTYPDEVEDRYTQLPESTPDRLGTFTDQLTADAENPYDTARVIEQWLETNKGYSLDVNRPSGDVAASFVFDMEAGYCVYFASAMTAMLRTQGIPARFVVGYTAGEPVGDGQWVVRGLDSHAWVEVYFPEHGWVAFDPTPADPRQSAERDRLEQARAAGGEDVDLGTPTPEPEAPTIGGEGGTPSVPEGVLDGEFGEDPNSTQTLPAGLRGPDAGAGGTGGGLGSGLPDGQTLLYGLILLVGAATAAQRTGTIDRGRRLIWLRRGPDGPPRRRVEGTFQRLDYLLGRRYRPRRRDETPRAYLSALRSRLTGGDGADATSRTGPHDQRVGRLFDLYERAHYAGRVTDDEADRAWQLLEALREEWSAWH